MTIENIWLLVIFSLWGLFLPYIIYLIGWALVNIYGPVFRWLWLKTPHGKIRQHRREVMQRAQASAVMYRMKQADSALWESLKGYRGGK